MSYSCLESLSKEELIEQVVSLKKENDLLKNKLFGHKEKSQLKKTERNFDFSNVTYRHVLLQICYLGWNYDGFTVQDNTINTIEFYLFEALKKTCLIECRKKSNYHRCGRTDKGVSAYSQVISIDLRSKYQFVTNETDQEFDYCKMLNCVLPENIRCISWVPVANDFSARFDCQLRTYKYFFNRAHMDIDRMSTAAKDLIGTHDFRNFCKIDLSNGVCEFTRTIVDARIEKCFQNDILLNDKSTYYDMYVLIIDGFAFLWHQIRYIMAVLILIGQRNEDLNIIKKLLDVNENPKKPIYNLALDIPLNLFEVTFDFDNIWIISHDDLKHTIKYFRKFWFHYSSKSVMLRFILDKLEKLANDNNISYNVPNDYMFTGIHSKKYKPLLKRQKCGE